MNFMSMSESSRSSRMGFISGLEIEPGSQAKRTRRYGRANDDLADINVRDDHRRLECHAVVVNAGVRSAQVFHEPCDVI